MVRLLRSAALLLGSGVVLAGCFSLDDLGSFPCATDGTCPSTPSTLYTCVGTTCLPECFHHVVLNTGLDQSCSTGATCVKTKTGSGGTFDGYCTPVCSASIVCPAGLECGGKACQACSAGSKASSCDGG
jgi:hypothetical protein